MPAPRAGSRRRPRDLRGKIACQAGLLSRLPDGRVFSVMGFTVADGRIVEIDILADAVRLARLDLSDVGM